jgi:exodeoxyribonuclease V gamma subunit
VSLRDDGLEVPDREPIELFGLERHLLGERLLDLRLEGVPLDELAPLVEASGALPYGAAGRCDLSAVLSVVDPLADRVRALREGGRARDASIEARLPGGVVVAGTLTDRFQIGLVRHQYAQVSGKHLLSLWIRHLALSLAGDSPSFLVGRASPLLHTQKPGSATPVHSYRFAGLSREVATRHLDDLVALYRLGRCEPLLLFPKSGFAQAGATADEVSPAARKIFETSERRYDPHLARLFADESVLSAESEPFGMPRTGPSFGELARRVFGPLRAALEVEG